MKAHILYIRLIAIMVILLTTVSGISAQVNIRGKVIDQENKPVEFATVKIKGTALGVNTGLDGDYKISAPKCDTLVVVFTCIGYEDESRTLVNASGDVTLNMRLREKIKELEGVEVTEIRKQTGSMQTIGSSDFKMSPDVAVVVWNR